jgi:hypothetical protein
MLKVRPMIRSAVCLILAAAGPALLPGVLSSAPAQAAAAPPPDTHAVVESTRLYMDQETKVVFEYWIAADRSSRTAARRTTITRNDLGLVWNLDLDAGTYTEVTIAKPGKEGPPARAAADMRKLWLDYYEPEYAWTIEETGESRSFNQFACREYRARGEADFAEMAAAYWICRSPGDPAVRAFHDYSLTQYRDGNRMAALLKLLEGMPDGICVYRQESVENSIAPTVRAHTELMKLEQAEAPAGTYEIPAGFRKLNGRGGRP